jgi:hypothetical protein
MLQTKVPGFLVCIPVRVFCNARGRQEQARRREKERKKERDVNERVVKVFWSQEF